MKDFLKFCVLVLIMTVGFVSANGLNLQDNTIQVDKTNGVEKYFNITILNQETFKFHNITAKGGVISFDKFDLDSGASKTLEVKVEVDNDFNGEVKIVGDYYTELGSSNETFTVEVGAEGIDSNVCNLDLIQGDTMIWNNNLGGDIKIRNINTGEYIATIFGGSQYQDTFLTALEMDYQIYKTGLPFSQICHLNIRPTSGFVHSSNYDTILNLDVNIIYEPTEVVGLFLTDDYTLEYNSEVNDLFKITNTGSKIAKEIKLSGDWFEFTENNFDLGVGASKNIGYKLKPFIYETSQTNKTYNKTIKIEGNFGTVEKGIIVFIGHRNLGGIAGDITYDEELLENMVLFFCEKNPDKCPTTGITPNSSNNNVTFEINEETYREKIIADDRFQESIILTMQNQNNVIASLSNRTDDIMVDLNETINEVGKVSDNTNNLLGSIEFGVIIILLVIVLLVMSALMVKHRVDIKLRKIFHDREKL